MAHAQGSRDTPQGGWIDPDAGLVLVADYGATWIGERPGPRPKTVELYRYLLRRYIRPHFEEATVADLDNAVGRVRRWGKTLLDSGVSAAKAYRFLRAVLNTAADDELIRRNPCRIKGAGDEHSPERPVLTVAQVYLLADAVGIRYRALLLLAASASLRWSELAALSGSIDLATRTVRVTRQISYQRGGGHSFIPPKSRAGRRVVSFPDLIAPDLRKHLDGLGASAVLVPPARRARRSATATSTGAHGCLRWPLSAWTAFTFTTCGTPATSSPPRQALTSAS